MVESEEILGIKLYILKPDSKGIKRPDLAKGEVPGSLVTIPYSGWVQVREYLMQGISVSTPKGIYLAGNFSLDPIKIDESSLSKFGYNKSEANGTVEFSADNNPIKIIFESVGDEAVFISVKNSAPFRVRDDYFIHNLMELHYNITGISLMTLKPIGA